MHGNVAEESKRLRLVAPSWWVRESSRSWPAMLARPRRGQQSSASPRSDEREDLADLHLAPGGHVFLRLREQGRASVVRPLSA